MCKKQVKSNLSLYCSLCRHFTHKNCIGKFSNKRKNSIFSEYSLDSFEYMRQYYKNTDWDCPTCMESIFPAVALNEDDFLMICSVESHYNVSKNVKEICKKLMNINLFNTSDDTYMIL